MIKLGVLLAFIGLLFVTGCSGGGSDGGSDGGTTTTETAKSSTSITGTAAGGAPVIGNVKVLGANGKSASSPIEADGSYSVDSAAL